MDSIWKKTVTLPPRDPLIKDIKTEVAIIGAGITGLLTAYFLNKKGIQTIILEANETVSGQTGNTTAKIALSHHIGYQNLIKKSESHARQYAKAHREAIASYQRMIEEEHIACDFRRCPSYLYTQTDVEAMENEADAASRAGLSVELTTQTELPFSVKRALKFQDQATFHPLKFLQPIAEHITIYEQTKVTDVKENTIFTPLGNVTAKHIVFACHYPFINLPGYYFLRMHQERSYVLALKETSSMDGMYLGIDHSGLSFRQSGDYLLLGGGGHRTGENKHGGSYEFLRTQSKIYWPKCKEVAHWSAQDCMTLDGIPYIGTYSSSTPNWYVATGFGKWGMTSAMVSAMLLSDQITGQDNPYQELFSPQRFDLSESAKNMMNEGAHAAKGLTKMGEFRCKHMGCKLEFNPDEQSYDCPCHGSRFDQNGELLNGPAQTNLEIKVEDKS